MPKCIFWFGLAVSFLFQGIQWINPSQIGDETIWSGDSMSIQAENSSQYPSLDAYMHPGGIVIEGTIAIHTLLKETYDNSLADFIILFNSLVIAGICVCCYLLRKNVLWPVAVLALLSLQPFNGVSLYQGLTPPSLFASLLFPALVLLSLYIYENKDAVRMQVWFFWCILAGLIVSSRIDIGGISVAALLLFFSTTFSYKKVILLATASFFAFCIFDPFMWFAPITQVHALISAMFTHYHGQGGYGLIYEYFASFPKIGILSVVGLLLGIVFVLLRKEIASPVPPYFLSFLLLLTAFLVFIFSSATTQASRYFMPVIFMWEVFLPLFIFSLVDKVEFSFVSAGKGQKSAQFLCKVLMLVLMCSTPALTMLGEILSDTFVQYL